DEDFFSSSGFQTGQFDWHVSEELRRVPGVLHVHPIRFNRIPFEGDRALLLCLDGGAPPRAGQAVYFEGSDADRPALARGEGVFVSEGFAHRFHRGRGTTIELPTPKGAVAFKVLAVVEDYSWPRGVIWIDDDLYRAKFEDDIVQEFGVTLDG